MVCTFASEEYEGSAEVLRTSALGAGQADRVYVFSEKDVSPWFSEHPELRSLRGYGWWSWKPFVILETMRRVDPGDVVVYCDAAMTFTRSLRPYAEAVDDILLFRLGHHETKDYRNKRWTKPDALVVCPESADVPQVTAAIQVYKHAPPALEFLAKYMDLCSRVELMDDTHRTTMPSPDFVDHRHDQSVLTMLALTTRCFRDPSQYGVTDTGTPVIDEDGPLVDHHRQRLHPPRVGVITPTVGGRYLKRCVESVQSQTLPNVEHYVVVDGPEHVDAVMAVVREFQGRKPITVVSLPYNVGAGGWNGHKVYGSMPWLVHPTTNYLAFLDDDNEYEPDHLKQLVRHAVGARVPWAYSLRMIIDASGAHVCPDNCESLGGLYHTVNGPHDRLIDTSCYLIEPSLAIQASPQWHHRFRSGKEADREVAKWLLSTAPHVCVRSHSVRYRVGNTPQSVTADFFMQGNDRLGYDFAGKPDMYIFHFSPHATARLLETRRRTDRSYALDEWQPTLLKGLDAHYNLLNGYTCAPNIPPGAVVYVSMCMPDQVPWSMLEARTDLWRIAYTLESPNIRHAAQWDPVRLGKHFDVVLTYWQPLLDDRRVTTLKCAHNTHHLDFSNPSDVQHLRANRGKGKSCVIVAENRKLSGRYSIPNMNVALECLDPLRERIVKDLEDVTVYGIGWDDACARQPGIKLGHSMHRSVDPRSSVDIMADYTFAIIVENCDAEGYVSEKLYDAFMAGCVPLYYGNTFLAIPEGVESGVYLDLKRFFGGTSEGVDGAKLREFLIGLSDAQVEAWKRRVVTHREAILRLVDTVSFAGAVKQAIDMRLI